MRQEKTFHHLSHPIVWHSPCNPHNQFFTIDLPPLGFVCLRFPYGIRRCDPRFYWITICQFLVDLSHAVPSFQHFLFLSSRFGGRYRQHPWVPEARRYGFTELSNHPTRSFFTPRFWGSTIPENASK
jgi:hypothetical protein